MFARFRTRSSTNPAGRTRLRLEALEDRWNPANPIVINTDDAGAGSLRAAVEAINNGGSPAPANTITFNIPAELDKVIRLESELVINANVTITGPGLAGSQLLDIYGRKEGSGLLLRGNRIFTVGEGRSVTLLNLRLLDGAAPAIDPNGGLIKVLAAGNLTVRDSTVWGGVAYNDGGGIWCDAGSRLTVTSSEIRRNDAGGNGGGIAFSGELLTVQTHGGGTGLPSTRIMFNDAGLNGGGVWVSGTGNAPFARVNINRVLVAGNEAGESGGGLYLTWTATATGVPVEMTDVTVSGNAALLNVAGGVFVNARTRMIRGSVVQNTARSPVAGIYDPRTLLIKVGNIDVSDNVQVIPEVPPEPTDPIPPTAVYIGPDAEALLVEASIRADGDGATYFWNDGKLEISSTEDAHEVGWSEFVGNYTQTATGRYGVDLTHSVGDQFQVSGAGYQVTLAGALDLHAHWTASPAYGTVYVIIKNDTSALTDGYFAGYPDAHEFWLEDAKFRINYGVYMGDPNDVILTVITPATVSGSFWWDENGDGVRNPEETLTSYGWVALFDANGVMVAQMAADEYGNFSFTVPPGTYQLYAAQASFVPTAQDAGTDDETDSDVNAFGYSTWFTLAPNGELDLDVGMVYVV